MKLSYAVRGKSKDPILFCLKQVTCEVVNDETLMTSSAVTSHGSDAGKYDLVVTTRKHHEQPSWLKTVELIEENEVSTRLYLSFDNAAAVMYKSSNRCLK